MTGTASLRHLALELHAAAVAGADPAAATGAALDRSPLHQSGRLWIVALGKAAVPMMRAAITALAPAADFVAGGLVISPERPRPLHSAVTVLQGDHPLAGDRSAVAAERLGEFLARVAPDDQLLVLLSGGASALVASPVDGVQAEDFRALHAGLLGAGADIALINAVRRRFARWGAGRLARAVAPAAVRCLAVSDVAGDDLATIGSGPCAPDPLSAPELTDLLERHRLTGVLPPRLRTWLGRVNAGELPETPKPQDPAFARVTSEVILSNRDALRAAGAAAVRGGATCELARDELSGDASPAGRAIAALLLSRAASREAHAPPHVVLFGGETTVRLHETAGVGGRCQELALAAAELLHSAGDAARDVVLLAAGTDGRDGPTDAAGAIVDVDSWSRAAQNGVDPGAALERHDAYSALDASGDLLRSGPTGTNVRDVVIGIVGAYAI